jgi:phosphoribosyl-ATP pyrophosphohydrolase
MIIPLINIGSFSQSDDGTNNHVPQATSLSDCIRHWSLFGKLAIRETYLTSQQALEQLVQIFGGGVDLLIAREKKSEAELLDLLNAGASAIFDWNSPALPFEAIPQSAWLVLTERQANLKRGNQILLADPTPDQVAQLDHQGVDVFVDAELLEREPGWIADFFKFALNSDRPDQLWPTVIVDELGLALGLAYSNYESLADAIRSRRGSYWSRSRNELWVKGASSGNTQRLIGIRLDCDRDSLRFQVTQAGSGFCHLGTYSCFGQERNIATVVQRLDERCQSDDEGSFTKKLIHQPEMLRAKLLEEAQELSQAQTQSEITFEAADVLYFTLVKMVSAGIGLDDVYQELARRMTRVIRRKNKLEPDAG